MARGGGLGDSCEGIQRLLGEDDGEEAITMGFLFFWCIEKAPARNLTRVMSLILIGTPRFVSAIWKLFFWKPDAEGEKTPF